MWPAAANVKVFIQLQSSHQTVMNYPKGNGSHILRVAQVNILHFAAVLVECAAAIGVEAQVQA